MVSVKLVLAVCVIGAVISSIEAGSCRKGDFHELIPGYIPRCLSIQNEKLTWQQALDGCRSQGGYLLTYSIRRAQELFRAYVKKIGYTQNLWLGGKKNSRGVWKWESIRRRSIESHFVWAAGEPNGSGGCLHMWAGRAHKFDDIPCGYKLNSVCAFCQSASGC